MTSASNLPGEVRSYHLLNEYRKTNKEQITNNLSGAYNPNYNVFDAAKLTADSTTDYFLKNSDKIIESAVNGEDPIKSLLTNNVDLSSIPSSVPGKTAGEKPAEFEVIQDKGGNDTYNIEGDNKKIKYVGDSDKNTFNITGDNNEIEIHNIGGDEKINLEGSEQDWEITSSGEGDGGHFVEFTNKNTGTTAKLFSDKGSRNGDWIKSRVTFSESADNKKGNWLENILSRAKNGDDADAAVSTTKSEAGQEDDPYEAAKAWALGINDRSSEILSVNPNYEFTL